MVKYIHHILLWHWMQSYLDSSNGITFFWSIAWKLNKWCQTQPKWHCSFPTLMKKHPPTDKRMQASLLTCYCQPTTAMLDCHPAADFPCHQWWHPTWQFRCLPLFQLPTICCGLHPIWRRATPSPLDVFGVAKRYPTKNTSRSITRFCSFNRVGGVDVEGHHQFINKNTGNHGGSLGGKDLFLSSGQVALMHWCVNPYGRKFEIWGLRVTDLEILHTHTHTHTHTKPKGNQPATGLLCLFTKLVPLNMSLKYHHGNSMDANDGGVDVSATWLYLKLLILCEL